MKHSENVLRQTWTHAPAVAFGMWVTHGDTAKLIEPYCHRHLFFFIAVLLLYHIYFLLHFALQYNNCSKSTGVVKLVVVVDIWPLRRVHPLSARRPFKKIQLHSTNEHIYYKSAVYVRFFPSSQLLGGHILFYWLFRGVVLLIDRCPGAGGCPGPYLC